jgi:hypothetical protein
MRTKTREATKVRAAHPSYKISGALRDADNIFGFSPPFDAVLRRLYFEWIKRLLIRRNYRYPELNGEGRASRPGDHAACVAHGIRAIPQGGTMRMRALLPAALLLAVAGCSGGGSGPAGPSASQSAPASSSATTTNPTSGSQSPSASAPPTTAPSLPTDVSTSLNAIDALQKHTCAAAPDGSWTFKGTLLNTSDKAKTYTVAVAVTVGAAVQGHTLITETLQPGKSAEVSAENFAKTTGQEGTCEPVVSVEDAS